MLDSSIARAYYSRQSAWLLGNSLFNGAISAAVMALLLAVMLADGSIFMVATVAVVAMYGLIVSLRYWLRHTDLEIEIDTVEKELIKRETGR